MRRSGGNRINMNPLISIIIPVYNVERYLDRCIESIISQTYRNLEIIIIDDGSSDSCGEKCDFWAAKDPRIIAVHQSNGGHSRARNAGLDRMTGNYVMFVDSDDYIDPCMVEKLYTALLTNQTRIAMCGFWYEDLTGNRYNVDNRNSIMNGKVEKMKALELFCHINHYTCFLAVWNKIYDSALFQTVRFPPGKLCEDAFVMYQLIFQCDEISCISEKLYYYVQSPDSITRKEKTVRHLDAVEAFCSMARFCEEKKCNGISACATQRAINEYLYYMNCLNPSTTEEKERIFEVRRMVYQCIRKNLFKIRLWDVLHFCVPGIYNVLWSAKHKLLR